LDPDGETIKLLRPGLPEPDGTVPYYRVDYVSYRTNIPWAQTLTGMSLDRVPVEAYGADPASWQAGPVNGSPGLPAGNRAPAITLSGNPVIPQLAPLRLQFTVTDLDIPWQSVTLTPVQVPPGSSYDPATRALTWTPSAAQSPGNYPVRMIAVDTAACGGGRTVLEFDIQVTGQLALTWQYNAGAGEIQLSFYALAGETYRVEYCTDLGLGDWQLWEEITVPQSTIFTAFEAVSPATSARFYRVLWQTKPPA
jgi:hypothetical protein